MACTAWSRRVLWGPVDHRYSLGVGESPRGRQERPSKAPDVIRAALQDLERGVPRHVLGCPRHLGGHDDHQIADTALPHRGRLVIGERAADAVAASEVPPTTSNQEARASASGPAAATTAAWPLAARRRRDGNVTTPRESRALAVA